MKKICLLYAASLVASGCSQTVQAPALHDFGALNPPAQNRQRPASAEIKIDAPKWLKDNRIRYRLLYDQPTRVRYYTLDLWIAPPPELLKQYLAAELIDSGYSLALELQNFEQQFDAPGSASVLMRFSAAAYAAGGKNKLAGREFTLRSASVSPDAQGAVKGFAALAEQANRQLQAWLVNLAKR
ncbi:MAG: ABC-type transport auxiliary lipoprotein family protein [Gammaproteobacteria bacterium]